MGASLWPAGAGGSEPCGREVRMLWPGGWLGFKVIIIGRDG